MDHLAILSKGKILEKILSGQKTIESRWYRFRRDPYGTINSGDRIYFKESGEPVTAMAEVEKTEFFSDLTLEKIKWILRTYGKQICADESSAHAKADKRYCSLIFIKNVKQIEPFHIDKTGYGNAVAWIRVQNIDKLRK